MLPFPRCCHFPRQSRAASWGQAREVFWQLAVPGVSSHTRLPNPCPAWWRELWGRAGLCLLHPRPWARMPAGPGHSRQQHVPTAVTLLSLPAESSPVLLWWQCSLQLPAGKVRGGCRQCGLLRLGPVSKSSGHGNSSLWDQPGTPPAPSLNLASGPVPPAASCLTMAPLCTKQVRNCLPAACGAASWGALALLTGCVQCSCVGMVLLCPSSLPSLGRTQRRQQGPSELWGQPGPGSCVCGVGCSWGLQPHAGAAAGLCWYHPGQARCGW